MGPTDIAAFLSRVANDEAYRDLLESDPDRALAAFDLPPDVQELARRRDASALALLTWERQGEARPEPKTARPAATLAELGVGDPLPPVEMVLRLVPTHVRDAEGREHVAHAASLHPLPAPGQPLAGQPPGAPDGVRFAIRVSPLAMPRPDGMLQLTYAASIHPLGVDRDASLQADTSVPTNPWGHRADEDAQAAAARVLAADPDARYPALLDLIAAIVKDGGAR